MTVLLNGVFSGIFFMLGTLAFLSIAIINFVNYAHPIQKMWTEIIYLVAMIFYLIGSILMLTAAIVQNRKIQKNNELIEQNNELIEQNVQTIETLKTELEEIIVEQN